MLKAKQAYGCWNGHSQVGEERVSAPAAYLDGSSMKGKVRSFEDAAA